MSESLSPSSPIRSCGRSPRSEARPTYTADSALLLSSSEEVDEESIEDVSSDALGETDTRDLSVP